MKITRISHEQAIRKKRVAAYARVSTLQEEQEESFETQVSYYTSFITSNPDWIFVKMYSDNGISGTSIEKRPGFKEMLKDAFEGKIDLIFVKSISRFGRNSYEAQKTLHELKEHKVEVRFEREGISSFDGASEMLLNFMTAIAQEESRSISENVIWTYERLAEKGIRRVGSKATFGYDEVGTTYVPNEHANTIRLIFQLKADGKTALQIADILNDNGLKSKKGLACSEKMVTAILNNRFYLGERVLQPKPHINYLTKEYDLNRPYYTQQITNDHEPLVSVELWEKAHSFTNKKGIKHPDYKRVNNAHGYKISTANRKKTNPDGSLIINHKNSHPLRGILFCSECGCLYVRRNATVRGEKMKYWCCLGREQHNGCQNNAVEEKLITSKFTFIPNKVVIHPNKVIEIVK